MSFAKLEDAITVPLFPLRIVLFPAGRHDLQIFERRYIDMVTESLKSGTPFGICSIEAGTGVRAADTQHSVNRIGHLPVSSTGINSTTVCSELPSKAQLNFVSKTVGRRTLIF
jgi:Lon protease-like protein